MIAARFNTRGRRAFTLVEVLATLLVVGIVLPAVMEGFSMAMFTGRIAATKREASGLAEAKLNELVATKQWNMSGTGGEFEDHPGYQWEVQVMDRDSTYGIVEISVRVSWMVRTEQRSVTVSTFVYSASQTVTGGGTSGTGTQQ